MRFGLVEIDNVAYGKRLVGLYNKIYDGALVCDRRTRPYTYYPGQRHSPIYFARITVVHLDPDDMEVCNRLRGLHTIYGKGERMRYMP